MKNMKYYWRISTSDENWQPMDIKEECRDFHTPTAAYRDGMNALKEYVSGIHLLEVICETPKEYSVDRGLDEYVALNNNGNIEDSTY